MTSEPSTQRVIDAVAPPSLGRPLDATGWYEGGDGMLAAVHRWDRRLDWGSGGPNFFASTVVVRLGELADERLRLRTTSPERATRPGPAPSSASRSGPSCTSRPIECRNRGRSPPPLIDWTSCRTEGLGT